jgi:hypothetical protein
MSRALLFRSDALLCVGLVLVGVFLIGSEHIDHRVVWLSDRRAQKYPERRAENHPEKHPKRLKHPEHLEHPDWVRMENRPKRRFP